MISEIESLALFFADRSGLRRISGALVVRGGGGGNEVFFSFDVTVCFAVASFLCSHCFVCTLPGFLSLVDVVVTDILLTDGMFVLIMVDIDSFEIDALVIGVTVMFVVVGREVLLAATTGVLLTDTGVLVVITGGCLLDDVTGALFEVEVTGTLLTDLTTLPDFFFDGSFPPVKNLEGSGTLRITSVRSISRLTVVGFSFTSILEPCMRTFAFGLLICIPTGWSLAFGIFTSAAAVIFLTFTVLSLNTFTTVGFLSVVNRAAPDFKTETVFTIALVESLVTKALLDNEDARIADTFGILTFDGKCIMGDEGFNDVVAALLTVFPIDFGI